MGNVRIEDGSKILHSKHDETTDVAEFGAQGVRPRFEQLCGYLTDLPFAVHTSPFGLAVDRALGGNCLRAYNCSGRNIEVSEQVLNRPQMRSTFQQVRGIGRSEHVRKNFADPGF